MNASITTTILKHRVTILILLSLLIVTFSLEALLQPSSVKASHEWGQCMTGGWVGPTWYSYDCSASEAAAASSCASAGGSFSVISVPSECTVICSDAYDWYFCDIPPPPTCATAPTMDGCACSKTNVCNTDTTNGAFLGGTCNAPEPAPCCDPAMGNVCTTSNSCGDDDSTGTTQCNGSCSSPVPPEVDACPTDLGLQCSGPCGSCAPAAGTACTANDGCSANAAGTFACDGTTCNLPDPDVCPSDAGLQCNLPCPSSCSSNQGNQCNINSCGDAGGVYACDGTTCSGSTPSDTTSCTSSANSCGMTNTGTRTCSGPCSASTPLDSACPANPGLSLTITPTFVQKGQATTLSWTATSEVIPMNCRLYGPGINDTFTLASFNGSRFTNPINAKSEFTLVCTEPVSSVSFTRSVIVETAGEIEEI